MELNGAALNVNKPHVTSRKTAFLKDNKVENEYPAKLWLHLGFINLLSSELIIICAPRKKLKLKCFQGSK